MDAAILRPDRPNSHPRTCHDAAPIHGVRQPLLVASLRHQIEEVISAHKDVESARVRWVGMEDAPSRILIEDAEPRQLLGRCSSDFRVVVVHLARRNRI